jgi:hypothetical protein
MLSPLCILGEKRRKELWSGGQDVPWTFADTKVSFFCPDYVHFFDLTDYSVKINKYFQLHTQSISLYRLRGELLSLTISIQY